MATVKICDECKEQKPTPFTVKEKGDKSVYELCSLLCLEAHGKRMERGRP